MADNAINKGNPKESIGGIVPPETPQVHERGNDHTTQVRSGGVPPKIPPVRSDDTDEKSGSSSKSSGIKNE